MVVVVVLIMLLIVVRIMPMNTNVVGIMVIFVISIWWWLFGDFEGCGGGADNDDVYGVDLVVVVFVSFGFPTLEGEVTAAPLRGVG